MTGVHGTDRGRDAAFDAVKGLLALLTVSGHLLEYAPDVAMCDWAYRFIYMFHMPAFCFVSGWFGHGSDTWKTCRRCAYAYVTWQCAYLAFFLAFVPGGLSSVGFAVPVWLMWYLVGLMAWRIILEIIRPWFEAHPWRCVGVALAVGMLAGFDPDAGYVLSWSRTVAFLPYYLAGAACRRTGRHPAEAMARLGHWKYFVAIAGPAVTALSAWASGSLPVAALYGSTPYGGWGWAAVRSCQYVSAFPMTAALFVLVPSGSGWLRKMGRRSLYVYLAHGIPVKLLGRVMDGLPLDGLPGGCVLAGSFVLAAAVSSVCAGRTAGGLMRPLTVPPWERDGK